MVATADTSSALKAQHALDSTAGSAPAAVDPGPLFETRAVLSPRDPRLFNSILGQEMRQSSGQFAHRMVWTLFPDVDEEAKRAGLFLFHVERQKPMTLIVRSRVAPADGVGGIWQLTTRPFDPQLVSGQPLRFRLRAVASQWVAQPGKKRGRRTDVIDAAWDRIPRPDRTDERLETAASEAVTEWLTRQGTRCGFTPGPFVLMDLDRTRIAPKAAKRGAPQSSDIRFGALTLEGQLTVTEPVAFRRMLADGVGHGRAYGNGLMQIAPAR